MRMRICNPRWFKIRWFVSLNGYDRPNGNGFFRWRIPYQKIAHKTRRKVKFTLFKQFPLPTAQGFDTFPVKRLHSRRQTHLRNIINILGTKKLTLTDIGEFGLIRSIQKNCRFSDAPVITGIGDDCAVLGPYDGKIFLVTTDLLLEDIHFTLKKINPEHLGEKALNVNLSDVAAMGGSPLHAFVSLAVPKSMPLDTIHGIYRGLKNSCKTYSVDLLGGDTSASPDRLMISITLVGQAKEGEVLLRSGARPKDHIYVTGTIGDSSGGMELILGKASAPESLARTLINAHNRPVPFLDAGQLIGESRLASAMIDLSDGLAGDLGHICESSGVGASLIQEDLPISNELKSLAEINSFDPYDMALTGGEDYKLLVTVPTKNAANFLKMFEKGSPCRIFKIGEITEHRGLRLIRPDGKTTVLEPKGFDHFGG